MDRVPQVTARQWAPELIERFQPAAARNPWGALESPGEALHGSYLFEVEHRGGVALMAVRPGAYTHGVRAEITGLVSQAQRFDAAMFDRAALMVAHQLGASVLGMSTQLPALVRACERQGWRTTGAIVTKNLGH